jgi:cytochrome P450
MPVNMRGDDRSAFAMHASPASAPASAPAFSLAAPPPGFVADPYPVYAALREAGPLCRLGERSWFVLSHADALAVYRHPAARSDKRAEFGPKFGEGTPLFEHHTTSLVFSDPPRHTRVRRILTGALDQRAIARMEAGVVALVEGLLEGLEAEAAPDAIEHFAAAIPVEVIGNLLAVPHADRAPLRGWSLAILSALEPQPSPAALEAGHTAVRDFAAYLRELVADRRAHPGDPAADVLTRLAQGDAEGVLEEAELLHNCIFLLNAGHETTTNLIGNGLHALLHDAAAMSALRAAVAGAAAAGLAPQAAPLVATAVEELLRFESPLQLNNRFAADRIELLSGHAIPAGDFVTIGIGAANRDPAVFTRPDTLDLARRPNPHLAFGQGAHACSGMNVARMEARIAIARLVQRFPRLASGGTAERDPRVRFRGFRRLPVATG